MITNSKILASIAKCDDPKMLRTWIENAEKKKDGGLLPTLFSA